MKLKIENKRESKTKTISVRVAPKTHKLWKDLVANNSSYTNDELMELAFESLIKKYGE